MAEALTYTLEARDGGVEQTFKDVDQALQGLAQHSQHGERALQDTTEAVNKAAHANTAAADTATQHGLSLDQLKAGLAATATVAASLVAGLVAMTMQVTSAATETDRWAQRLGVTVESMSQLAAGAKRFGIDTENLGQTLQQFSGVLADAAAGSGPAAEAFEQMGLSAVDAAGNTRNLDAVLPELADRLAGMTNATDRAALAAKLFGEDGAALLPMLMQGAAGLEEMRQKADAYGATLSQNLVAQSRQLQGSLADLMLALQGTANTIVAAVLPSLNAMMPQVTAFVAGLRDSSLVQQSLIPLLQGTAEVIGVMASNLYVVEQAWNTVNAVAIAAASGVVGAMSAINKAWATLTDRTTALGVAFNTLANAVPAVALLRTAMGDSAEATRATATELDTMQGVLDEMGTEWLARNEKLKVSQEEQKKKLDEIHAGLKTVGTDGPPAIDAVANAAGRASGKMGTMKQSVEDILGQLDTFKTSWDDLGIAAPKALDEAAEAAAQSMAQIAADGKNSAHTVMRGWEAMKDKVIAVLGFLPPEMQSIDDQMRAGNLETARAMMTDMNTNITQMAGSFSKLPPAAQSSGNQLKEVLISSYSQAAQGSLAAFVPLEAGAFDAFGNITAAARQQAEATRAAYEQSLAGVGQAAATAAQQASGSVAAGVDGMSASVDYMTQTLGTFAPIHTSWASDLSGLKQQYQEIALALSNVNHISEIGAIGLREWQREQWLEALRILEGKMEILRRQEEENERREVERLERQAEEEAQRRQRRRRVYGGTDEDEDEADTETGRRRSRGGRARGTTLSETGEDQDLTEHRTLHQDTYTVQVNYTGVMDANGLVRDIREALDNAVRNGQFTYLRRAT